MVKRPIPRHSCTSEIHSKIETIFSMVTSSNIRANNLATVFLNIVESLPVVSPFRATLQNAFVRQVVQPVTQMEDERVIFSASKNRNERRKKRSQLLGTVPWKISLLVKLREIGFGQELEYNTQPSWIQWKKISLECSIHS